MRSRTAGAGRGKKTDLRRVLRRALLAALAVPFAVPAACILSDSTEGSGGSPSTTSSGTAGAGGGTQSSTGGEAMDGGADANPCDPSPYLPDAPDDCGVFVRLPCGLPEDAATSTDCYLTHNDCVRYCGSLIFSCRAIDDSCVDGSVVNDPDGGINVDCVTCVGGLGRVPEGLSTPHHEDCQSAVGAYLSRAAHLEAASVHAFRRLAAELTSFGAPESLIRRARVAEEDEVRHARTTARLARRFGARPPRARVRETAARPLGAVARENAVEGCVRETFGAAIAAFQSERAADPEIRAALRTIAREEARHAALSWSVARWSRQRLSKSERAAIAADCRRAITRLRREALSPVPPDLATTLGLPSPAQQLALIETLEREAWRTL